MLEGGFDDTTLDSLCPNTFAALLRGKAAGDLCFSTKNVAVKDDQSRSKAATKLQPEQIVALTAFGGLMESVS
jgi:hypothetical protein